MAAVLEEDVMEEARVSRLESDVAHVQRDISDIKIDVREMRKDLGCVRVDVAGLREEMQRTAYSTRLWMVSLIGAVLTIMAHGFKWI